MRVGDQIRSRRQQVGMSVAELAKAAGVSEQSVRYWESGRSDPNKTTARRVEEALGITLDWSEGKAPGLPSATSVLSQADVELMLRMSRLPMPMKILFGELAEQILKNAGPVPGFAVRERAEPVQPFSEKVSAATNRGHNAKQRRKAR